MIRIRRGHEPAHALKKEREKRLAVIRGLPPGTRLDRKSHIVGYDLAKDELWRSQHFKCCYCEKNNMEKTGSAVEHFRPALSAKHGDGFPSHNGYWWLAWTWNNLMFVCDNCNSCGAKVDKFPLDAGSVPLAAEEKPPGGERPLLIDPGAENPVKHIKFQRAARLGKPVWLPVPRNGSLRGQKSIEVLKLDRPELLDLYELHFEEYVQPEVVKVERAMGAVDKAEAQRVWSRDVARLISPRRPFTALSYDVFDHYFPKDVRSRWGLPLRQPR